MNNVFVIARNVAETIRAAGYDVDVTRSAGRAGSSAYIHIAEGDIRISDHYADPHRRPNQLAEFDVASADEEQISDWIISYLAERPARHEAKAIAAAKRLELVEAEKQAARLASADIVAEQAANRAAKLAFWEMNGMSGATKTARENAWKAHKKEAANA